MRIVICKCEFVKVQWFFHNTALFGKSKFEKPVGIYSSDFVKPIVSVREL